MGRRLFATGVPACRLDDHIDPELTPREGLRIRFTEYRDPVGADDHGAALNVHRFGKASVHGIVGEQPGKRLRRPRS